ERGTYVLDAFDRGGRGIPVDHETRGDLLSSGGPAVRRHEGLAQRGWLLETAVPLTDGTLPFADDHVGHRSAGPRRTGGARGGPGGLRRKRGERGGNVAAHCRRDDVRAIERSRRNRQALTSGNEDVLRAGRARTHPERHAVDLKLRRKLLAGQGVFPA